MSQYFHDQMIHGVPATDLIDGSGATDGLVRMYAGDPPETSAVCQNPTDGHDTARFLHETGERPDRLLMATVMQMTLPGAPGLYYGGEVGMAGGEQPASRGAYSWHDEDSWGGRRPHRSVWRCPCRRGLRHHRCDAGGISSCHPPLMAPDQRPIAEYPAAA